MSWYILDPLLLISLSYVQVLLIISSLKILSYVNQPLIKMNTIFHFLKKSYKWKTKINASAQNP